MTPPASPALDNDGSPWVCAECGTTVTGPSVAVLCPHCGAPMQRPAEPSGSPLHEWAKDYARRAGFGKDAIEVIDTLAAEIGRVRAVAAGAGDPQEEIIHIDHEGRVVPARKSTVLAEPIAEGPCVAGDRPFKMHVTPEWYLEMALREGDAEVGAGPRHDYLLHETIEALIRCPLCAEQVRQALAGDRPPAPNEVATAAHLEADRLTGWLRRIVTAAGDVAYLRDLAYMALDGRDPHAAEDVERAVRPTPRAAREKNE